LAVVSVLKAEGYDVEYWPDVENLEKLTDGRYHVIFLDVRGIGSKYRGNGLDVLKYVATYNPLVYTVVFSAKPFTPSESELVRRYAKHCISKDSTAYEMIDLLHQYASSIDAKRILAALEKHFPIGWYVKWKLRAGKELSERDIQALAKHSATAHDAYKIAANCAKLTTALIKISAVVASG
jgi:hypothetical protein